MEHGGIDYRVLVDRRSGADILGMEEGDLEEVDQRDLGQGTECGIHSGECGQWGEVVSLASSTAVL